jgi:hypothetical protein
MDKGIFIDLEYDDDIVIALTFGMGAEFDTDGFVIQRNRRLEKRLEPRERGACVEWEDHDDIRVLLDKVHISRDVIDIKTKGKLKEYQFDISGLHDEDYKDLVEHFKLINFDNSIKIKYE